MCFFLKKKDFIKSCLSKWLIFKKCILRVLSSNLNNLIYVFQKFHSAQFDEMHFYYCTQSNMLIKYISRVYRSQVFKLYSNIIKTFFWMFSYPNLLNWALLLEKYVSRSQTCQIVVKRKKVCQNIFPKGTIHWTTQKVFLM